VRTKLSLCILASLAIFIAIPLWAQQGIKVASLLKSSVTANGQKIEYLKTDKPEITALVVEIAPGQETGWHKHPVPAYGYILEGAVSVAMENGVHYEYHAGQALIEVTNTWHNGKNMGTVPVKILVFFTGEKGRSYTVYKK
jgi:quercetin dioxygenase-like cupin family protein